MKKIISFLILALFWGFIIPSGVQAASDVELSWSPSADHEALGETGGYLVYYGTELQQDNSPKFVHREFAAKETRHTLKDLPDGTYYFAVTAVKASATGGIESCYSNWVSLALDTVAPAPPTGVVIKIVVIGQ